MIDNGTRQPRAFRVRAAFLAAAARLAGPLVRAAFFAANERATGPRRLALLRA
jgi:hypothetical protein